MEGVTREGHERPKEKMEKMESWKSWKRWEKNAGTRLGVHREQAAEGAMPHLWSTALHGQCASHRLEHLLLCRGDAHLPQHLTQCVPALVLAGESARELL